MHFRTNSNRETFIKACCELRRPNTKRHNKQPAVNCKDQMQTPQQTACCELQRPNANSLLWTTKTQYKTPQQTGTDQVSLPAAFEWPPWSSPCQMPWTLFSTLFFRLHWATTGLQQALGRGETDCCLIPDQLPLTKQTFLYTRTECTQPSHPATQQQPTVNTTTKDWRSHFVHSSPLGMGGGPRMATLTFTQLLSFDHDYCIHTTELP